MSDEFRDGVGNTVGAVGVCVAGLVTVGWAGGVAVEVAVGIGVAAGGRVGCAADCAGVGCTLLADPCEGAIFGAERIGPRTGVAVWAGGSVTTVAVGVAVGMAAAGVDVAVGAAAAGAGVLVGTEAGAGCPAGAGCGADEAAPGLAGGTTALPSVTKGIDASLSLMTA